PIIKGKTGFSLSLRGADQFDVQTIRATTSSGRVSDLVTQPTERLNVDLNLEHVVNETDTLRFASDRSTNARSNLGVGDFALPERACNADGVSHQVRLSNFGTFSKKYLNETRVQFSIDESNQRSLSNAPTIRVQDTYTSGGAQVDGGT